ncbi:MAG: DUF1934 domain-containing protein [Ruminococcaceae bacterium]|nr:DUF1934 domain-containing protein [Oscillospiraceae bacterium]
MKKDVIITIRGLQNFEDADNDSIELVTSGRFYEKGGSYYVSYKESELTGLGDTTTTVKIEDDKVTVMRFGELQTHMIFEEGQKHISYYDMGFGALTVGVSTKSINKQLSESGGSMKIDYAMEINNAVAGESALFMDIRETATDVAN